MTTAFITNALFGGMPAYQGMPVLVALDPGSGVVVVPGFVVSVDEMHGGATIGIANPALAATFGSGVGQQITNVPLTAVTGALAGDPTQLIHFTWMPLALAMRGARAAATIATSAPTRATSTYAVIPEMTVTLTPILGGDAWVSLACTFNLQDSDSWLLAIFVDGVQYTAFPAVGFEFHGGALLGLTPGHFDQCPYAATVRLLGLTANASHTIDVRWKQAAGTARAVGVSRYLSAWEG